MVEVVTLLERHLKRLWGWNVRVKRGQLARTLDDWKAEVALECVICRGYNEGSPEEDEKSSLEGMLWRRLKRK